MDSSKLVTVGARSAYRPPTSGFAGVGTLRLVPNRGCDGDGHVMCWRVECRHCGDCLAAHADVRTLRVQTAELFHVHACTGTPT